MLNLSDLKQALRYDYGRFRSREKAETYLDDMFASGEVSAGERPQIERRLASNKSPVWVLTLLG
jgi:hypothetical protein